MKRVLALAWLAVVLAAGVHLALRLHHGLPLRTDLASLLPRDENDPALRRANEAVTRSLSRRVFVLVGHKDRDTARQAAVAITQSLQSSKAIDILPNASRERFQEFGAAFFAYRRGLLSNADRQRLLEGRPETIAARAQAQIFGFISLADSALLRADPFLLMPAFLASLPLPTSRVVVDDGLLTVVDDDSVWILVVGRLNGEPMELDLQDRLDATLSAAIGTQRNKAPGLEVLRLGAVFFAHAGAQVSLEETATLGLASTVGTVVLILVVFRALTPLMLSVLAIGIGVGAGLSATLLMFGELHVASLLFGVSLIGVAADYTLYYSAEVFAADAGPPQVRLARIMPGITMGLITTVVGYAMLLLAPFPGLKQVAVFSVVGLVACYLTVVLWLPLLDRSRPAAHGARMLALAMMLWRFWDAPRWRSVRRISFAILIALGILGAMRLTVEDDIRRMQAVSPRLVSEQMRFQQLVGLTAGAQFFVVKGADHEAALRQEEELLDRLSVLRKEGALVAYRAPASFVPSAQRQHANRALLRERLETPLLASHLAALGLPESELRLADDRTLTIPDATSIPVLSDFIGDLVLPDMNNGAVHIVLLEGVRNVDMVRAAVADIDGVRLVDPASDFSSLLARYRHRALVLTGVSAVVVVGLVMARFGLIGGLRVMLPSLMALVLAPLLKAIWGSPFTFFDAMALVLVLSISVDYAIFCAESTFEHRPVTLLAVWLTMVSTLLSFGLLALSDTMAVHAFGMTMLLGVALAFVLAPLAAPAQRPATGHDNGGGEA
ncbi:MMPL family transporter [Reyranella sp. CPCC 100927]|uniref:MMPL family transporter n=1 Tax=Reyranella sp. CPCC 100927 TaxID=2599616 RepID=UPI0011B6171E|nr:hypothetical protein [Reyranella sp. CPCC 100927]TWT13692.1 hypothetical protein FQU96_07180 [Reyranella sp. CPCC 100927]